MSAHRKDREDEMQEPASNHFQASDTSSSDGDEGDEHICAICLESLPSSPSNDAEVAYTPCDHRFHRACLQQCIQNLIWKCVICRSQLQLGWEGAPAEVKRLHIGWERPPRDPPTDDRARNVFAEWGPPSTFDMSRIREEPRTCVASRQCSIQ
mmetsp:Transcript_40144/g.62701  ORF Transcript_40144/g.62701 Transcript_40144/m.62701 type:complete len:153 (-) Transcript_40144:695-1153(-)